MKFALCSFLGAAVAVTISVVFHLPVAAGFIVGITCGLAGAAVGLSWENS